MTNSTSQCSTSRMKPTRPAGTFASTYTRVCSVSLSACGPSSDARVPMLPANSRFKMQNANAAWSTARGERRRGVPDILSSYIGFAFCILHFALPVSLQIGHRLRLLVGLRVRARRVLRLGTQLRDERVALVHQLLPLTAAISGADGVLAEQRERDRRIAIRADRVL